MQQAAAIRVRRQRLLPEPRGPRHQLLLPGPPARRQLRKAIVAADIEEASALLALETINLLAGVSDEPFRMNLRRRVAERLAQTPTISAT